MKGVILAGGMGKRLSPLTDIVNKFLLPIYNKPLIEYSVDTLKKAGIRDIAVILGKKSAGQTIDYLKSGKQYGVNFTYFYQDNPMGVPDALKYAEDFVGNDNVMVLCADNIILDNVSEYVDSFCGGCLISTKLFNDIDTLRRFAILNFDSNNNIIKVEEKPKEPKSNVAFCGFQIYDNKVFDIIKNLKLSDRGEYEITHVMNEYIKINEFKYHPLEDDWFDVGNPDALLEAQIKIFNKLYK